MDWQYYTIDGELKTEKGICFICDGGYLRWNTLICPYAGSEVIGQRGYFNTNLEGIRKNVECTFGILKKRWRILDYGLHYYDMKKCKMVFTVCCLLHCSTLEETKVSPMCTELDVGVGWEQTVCSCKCLWYFNFNLDVTS